MRYNPATDSAKTIEELAFPSVSGPKSEAAIRAESAHNALVTKILDEKYGV